MRFILTGTLLCVLASTALAGEHYTEVWNPPEARVPGAHPSTPDKKAHAHHGTKHKLASAGRLGTRKVAEPAVRASAASVPMLPNNAAPNGSKSNRDRTPFIPPQIGPDGNVLQVSYAAPAHRGQSPLMPLATVPATAPSAAGAR
ncbi:hypothetical protein LMG28688_04708 [Paraburkholderia caffeinitolerans]|uniref:Uncharacterized protein n=1 Tax=Paraburkholderia caffeinitolerans TaxID=1723730 RepID=A0A6J5GDM2_9BURK|nr:hypothetical protein [Paraburkholderia caffeinitolerans]CAB3798359.1 hypothetical protein LMG28688_04708 [Paraburkholderia caffeinitolerans]